MMICPLGLLCVCIVLALCATVAYAETGLELAKTGQDYFYKGDHVRAIEYFSKALDKGGLGEKDLVLVHLKRGISFTNTGRYNDAAADFTRVIKKKKYLTEAYTNRGNAYLANRQYVQAIDDFNEIIEQNPRDITGYYNRGRAYKAKGRHDLAYEDFQTTIGIDPKHGIVYYHIACIHALRNEKDEACKWLGRAVSKGYNDWKVIDADPELATIRGLDCYKEIKNRR